MNLRKVKQIKDITVFSLQLIAVVISPVGMEDTLVIDIEPICDCECSEEGSEGYDFTSEHCDYHGEQRPDNMISCFNNP